jgi:hypothetical protein
MESASQLVSGTTENINKIIFSGSTGFACGDNGTAIRTTNGETWQILNTQVTDTLNSIFIMDNLNILWWAPMVPLLNH